jgi:hypothetical protein
VASRPRLEPRCRFAEHRHLSLAAIFGAAFGPRDAHGLVVGSLLRPRAASGSGAELTRHSVTPRRPAVTQRGRGCEEGVAHGLGVVHAHGAFLQTKARRRG